jgi:hypothetical protein
MLIHVKPNADIDKLKKIVANSNPGDNINVSNSQQFEQLKRLIIDAKAIDLKLSLIDEDGYVLKQISTKRRDLKPDTAKDSDFTARQMAVISALERVMALLEKEGVNLVGYSDELVATISDDTSLQTGELAIDIDTRGIYKGAL